MKLVRLWESILLASHAAKVGSVVVSRSSATSASRAGSTSGAPRTITQVVKLLEGMLEKSQVDGDNDRTVYAKFKCYCDTRKEAKTAEIEALTKEISLHESKIEELQGSNGELSADCAKLDSDMAANEEARGTANATRERENSEYLATVQDLTAAISQMEAAIETLAEVGADQTLSVGADHKQYMRGNQQASLLGVQAKVKQALSVASAFLGAKQAELAASLLQKPFTGTYTSQSGEVVGILKNMRDTFDANLKSANTTERTRHSAWVSFSQSQMAEYATMHEMYTAKQGILGTNDGDLASHRQQLSSAVGQKTSREEFLDELIPLCERKSKEYKERNLLRVNEDAAISEAIAILNKDSSFQTFGTVAATSTGAVASFLQQSAVHGPSVRASVQQLLQKAQQSAGSSFRLSKVAALLAAENPFDQVLEEIQKMVALIEEEGRVDQNKLDWCTEERSTNSASLREKERQINSLTGQVNALNVAINDPEAGLKAMIQTTEDTLQENIQSQTSETQMRKEENMAYQKNIDNLVTAADLLKSATKVLKEYYAKLDGQETQPGPTVLPGETEAHPDTWRSYQGQSSDGSSVIGMLEYISQEVSAEERAAHSDENQAQHDYEDSMARLTGEAENLQANLASLQKTLADKELELLQAEEDLTKTKAEKKAIEDYLEDIKAGCDFITENFDLRQRHRATETTALGQAERMLKGTPAYLSAVAAADTEALGFCREKCEGDDRQGAICQACLSKVSVPGYCAGHPETPGC